MKIRKRILLLLLSAAVCFTTLPAVSLAEESAQTENQEETTEGESETEHPAAYYADIQSNAIKGWPQGPQVDADAALVMDARTGAILYSKDIQKKEYPASITKIMTTLIALEKGNLSDVVNFSANAVYSIEFGSSHLGLTEGEQLTLEQCLYGIMMASANEISNAVAEHIGGSVENYVQMMNDRAAELGCTNTHFVNVHGLHDENHYVSALDMGLIMQEALKNEKFREIISTVEYNYPETNKVDEVRYFMNHHKMIAEEGMLYDGCIGGKTGYTDDSWNTLVTAAERDGMELICVVLRCPGLYNSYEGTKVLLDYAFDNFQPASLTNGEMGKENLEITGIENQEELAKIQGADFTQEPFAMEETTRVTIPGNVDTATLQKRMDFTSGTLTYYYEGQPVGTSGFTYTGQWEPETEAPSETETETETETEKEAGALNTVKNIGMGIAGGAAFLYNQMDVFIKENTIVASILGAVLLFIFVPLLLVAINRSRKYHRLMELREEEARARKALEEEIEKKSAAQVEAELRAESLRMKLEEERQKRRRNEEEVKELENAAGFYYDEEEGEEAAAKKEEEAAEPADIQEGEDKEIIQETPGDAQEEEYIEVPLEEAEKDNHTTN